MSSYTTDGVADHAANRAQDHAADHPTEALRWPARVVCGDLAHDGAGSVCATVWPTRHLHSPMRWFDELYLWAEGWAPTQDQWYRIQLMGLRHALLMLAREQAEHLCVTLSYATVEQCDEQIDALLQAHALVAHRLVVLLRGSLEQAGGAYYRVRAFADYLRARQIPVGLRVTAPRLAMELHACSVVGAEFAKILAPGVVRGTTWDALAMEARFAGLSERWLIVAGLQSPEHVRQAVDAGIGFGQGPAVRPAHAPRLARAVALAG
jgi:hypothetical protein